MSSLSLFFWFVFFLFFFLSQTNRTENMADVGFENAQMKELMSALQKEKGVLKRKFQKDRTIVEQGSTNSCFYKLESGSIRFEKRVVGEGGIVEKVWFYFYFCYYYYYYYCVFFFFLCVFCVFFFGVFLVFFSCFYKLESGSIRFENEGGIVKKIWF